MAKTIKVDDTLRGKRADLVALEALPGLSRAYVGKLIDDQKINLNGELVKAGYRLKVGDKLKIDFDPSELEQIAEIDLPILYEDDDVLVVNKPAGVISQARGKFWNEPSVASFVRQKTGQEGERAGIVHRLDRATSGVMICAKNSKTLSHLQKQFSARKVKKTYLAIAKGHFEPKEAIIDVPIGRNPAIPQTFKAMNDGKPARTRYSVQKELNSFSELILTPETGRTHQLRVHLSHINHPIAGDELYNGPKADRLYLHAYTLELTMPSGERKKYSAPEPVEFKKFKVSHG